MSLRIGMVAHGGIGGSGTVASELAHGLAMRGHAVHLIVPEHPVRLPRGSAATVHEVRPTEHPMFQAAPWTLPLIGRVAEVAEAERLDLVHAHFAVPYAICADFARDLVGRPLSLVVTLHGTDVTQLSEAREYRALIDRVVRRAHRITVPSHALRAEVERRFGGVPSPVVVPNFVDAERFTPRPDRVPLPASGEYPLRLVHASSFRAVKRVEDVVAIFARVAEQVDARLVLVGDGPRLEPALAELTRVGLRERVELHPGVTDVTGPLGGAHVALMPSAEESFGLAALEAMSCGVPVVGSRIGGLPEVVTHGETGWLEPVGAVDAMAERALSLAHDPPLWQRMSTAARHRAITTFSPSTAFEAYEAVYRAALEPT